MSKGFVLDASTVLAVLNDESGADGALEFFSEGRISAVNMSEVLARLIERGHSPSTAIDAFELLQLPVVAFDNRNAQKAAEIRLVTKSLGLSLGDRACLALAIVTGATAVTADKAWKKLNLCPIEIVR